MLDVVWFVLVSGSGGAKLPDVEEGICVLGVVFIVVVVYVVLVCGLFSRLGGSSSARAVGALCRRY